MDGEFGCFSFVKKPLFVPSLESVSKVLQEELPTNFSEVKVDIVDCPDLSKEPFYLSGEGIGGNPSLIACGSMKNFIPVLRKDKTFDIKELSELTGLKSACLIGAGVTCCSHVNSVTEAAINVSVSDGSLSKNLTKTVRMDKTTDKHVLESIAEGFSEYPCFLDLLCTEGKKNKVLRVHCFKRIGELSLQSAIRIALGNHFKDKLIGVGGVFLVKEGKVKCHVNHLSTDYPPVNVNSVNEFIKKSCAFIDMSAPLVCVGELMSQDPGLDSRVEHFHCYSFHGDGGHVHYDTTPESVEYIGYFTLAQTLYQIDYPKEMF